MAVPPGTMDAAARPDLTEDHAHGCADRAD
jgi:hypothetical protein